MNVSPKKARPFCKWAGGKRQLLEQIKRLVPSPFHRYYEPFIGGGAVFYDLQPADAVISDANLRLVKTYRAVRDNVEGVIQLLSKCPHEAGFYAEVVALNVDTMNDVQTAAWLIYLNRTGFNGLYRVNKSGRFNVPFGDHKNPTICDADNLRLCSAALQNTDIRHGDFAAAVTDAMPGDLVYFDPPYIPLNKTSSFTAYHADGFGMDDQTRLRDVASDLAARGVHVVLSASLCEGTLALYDTPRFELHEVPAKRSINSRSDKRGEVSELLIRAL